VLSPASGAGPADPGMPLTQWLPRPQLAAIDTVACPDGCGDRTGMETGRTHVHQTAGGEPNRVIPCSVSHPRDCTRLA
jgi:hypothetical protein